MSAPPTINTGAIKAGAGGGNGQGRGAAAAGAGSGLGSRQESRGHRPTSPQAMSHLGREWQQWLRGLQQDINLLRMLDPDELFSTKANELRTSVAAQVIQLKTHVDDRVAGGLRNLNEEVQEVSCWGGARMELNRLDSADMACRLGSLRDMNE